MQRKSVDKRLVVEEAAALANELGFSRLSLKALADRLSIRPPSLYNHIASLDELRHELMVYGWGELCGRVEDMLICETGDEALRLACHVFFDYAVSNPGVFEAMAFSSRNDRVLDTDASRRFRDLLIRVLGKRSIREEKAVHVLRLVRSYVEGFALLVNNAAFDASDGELYESFSFGLELILEALHSLEE